MDTEDEDDVLWHRGPVDLRDIEERPPRILARAEAQAICRAALAAARERRTLVTTH